MADEIGVNRYCLINEVVEAMRLGQRFDGEQPEPGQYYVVQVLKPF